VTDLRMPDMSGVELLTKLGAANAMMPAIVITGHGDVPMAVAAMKAGALSSRLNQTHHMIVAAS